MSQGRRVRALPQTSFVKALIPLVGPPSSCPNQFPKGQSLNTITLGVEISTYEFWRDTNIQAIAAYNFFESAKVSKPSVYAMLPMR